MTVAADALSRWEYTGDDSTDTFAYTSKIYASTDLKVYADAVLVESGYSVTGVGEDSGGNVVFDTPPADDVAIAIRSEIPILQETSLPLGGPLPSSAIEAAMDRLTLEVQQLRGLVSALMTFDTDAEPVAISALTVAGSKSVTIDGTADPVVYIKCESDDDGVLVADTDGNSRVKLRINTGGHGVVVMKDSSGNEIQQHAGAGSPEGARSAVVGSTYHRTDGSAGTSFYVKESGSGNTGWVAK